MAGVDEPSDEDDALSQMIALLRATAGTLRFMAAAGVPESRSATLDAAILVEEAFANLERAAQSAPDVRRSIEEDPPSSH